MRLQRQRWKKDIRGSCTKDLKAYKFTCSRTVQIKANIFYCDTINNPLVCKFSIAHIREREVYIRFPVDIFTVDIPNENRIKPSENLMEFWVIKYVPTNGPT